MPKIRDLGVKVIPETMRPPEIGGGGGCTDCTVQQFSICGGTRGCTDCTNQPFSICGGTWQGCSDCTVQQFSICGGTHQGCTAPVSFGCTDCTYQAYSLCGGTQIGCTAPRSLCRGTVCACTHLGSICNFGSRPTCSIDPTIYQQPELTREQVAALKDSLRKQMEALEAHEKTLGPKTLEELEAREKQLNDELAMLKARRKDLK